MKRWVLCNPRRARFVGITAVTTDPETAAIWRAEFPVYKAEEFDTDNAPREVLDV
jgi:hypothetical protein